ncbi:MAG: UDP-3-O-(3-hydroxymyristoyl)glucosamine N-acyltransferase [Acidobacteriota bacterium]|nr:UDP-3-O-(3-hydroxymyristoyl)glucosamine N-acyltransferase [Acidobacteriota bacterium]
MSGYGSASGGPFTVAELARRLGGEVEGDGARELVNVLPLAEAGPEHLSFLSNRRYYPQLETARAGAVLLDRETDSHGHTAIRCEDPYISFARALALFHPQPWPEPGIDSRAAVADDAKVGGATIEAFAWVGRGARVGAGTWIESGAYVGAGATVGERCRLMPHAVVTAGCRLGDHVWLNPGAVIGGEGFGFAPSPGGHTKIPQAGITVLEDDVEVGANSSVDRATMGETLVRRGAKLDNLVQVGHGAEIGEGCLLVAYAGVAGSSKLGKGVVMAAKSGVANHLEIGDGAQIATGSRVVQNQPAGARLSGYPAIDHRRWLRSVTAVADLPAMVRRLRKLEARVAELEKESD